MKKAFGGIASGIIFLISLVFLFQNLGVEKAQAVMVPVSSSAAKTMVQGEVWYVGGGYSVSVTSIDATSSPRQVWFKLLLNNTEVDNAVLASGNTYTYRKVGETFDTFSMKLDLVFNGATNSMVQFKPSYIDSTVIGTESTPATVSLLSNDTAGKKTLNAGQIWELSGGYALRLNSIDASANPRQAWFELTKNCVKVDDHTSAVGQTYAYSESGNTVFQVLLDMVFAGATSNMAQFRYPLINTAYNSYVPPLKTESWTCSAWTACAGGVQTRTCTDSNSCGTIHDKPVLAQTCTMPTPTPTPTPNISPTPTPGLSATPTPSPASLLVNVSTSKSTLTASPTILYADGIQYSLVTVTVKNDAGELMGGQYVKVYSTRGLADAISPAFKYTGADGVAAFEVRSSSIGMPTISAAADVFMLDQTQTIAFVAPGSVLNNPSTPASSSGVTLYRVPGDSRVYVIKLGKKHWIRTAEEFNANGYDWGSIQEISASALSIFPEEESSSTLVLARVKGDPKVYAINNGKKHWIRSAEEFAAAGYNWGDIIETTENVLSGYPDSDSAAVQIKIINALTLRVRSSNTTASTVLAYVKKGEVFPIIEKKNGWYKIKTNSGKIGWVLGAYAAEQ